MQVTAASLVVRALEEEGVRFTFGIPGTHNIELYDELERSSSLTPVLVTDEQCASFMADGLARSSDQIGVVNVVPGAGVTHCLPGVAEAYQDNVPLLVLTCGVRNDTGKSYQLHDIDQLAILAPVTKKTFRPETLDEVYPLVKEALRLCQSGTPGPVAVEIPGNLYLLSGPVTPPTTLSPKLVPAASQEALEQAADLLNQAKRPALYLGRGALRAGSDLVELAERLGAPVVTTISGKGVFPESHPLWLWNGFGSSAPTFVERVMHRCDVCLALGCRFSQPAASLYGMAPPERLIHVDINPQVFDRNFPAWLTVESDAQEFVKALLEKVDKRPPDRLQDQIAEGHARVLKKWSRPPGQEGVTPFHFFNELQKQTRPETYYVSECGELAFLLLEQLRLDHPTFIAPVDFACDGFSLPAALGVKLVQPRREVVALAHGRALLMTGLEMVTARHCHLAPLFCVCDSGSRLEHLADFAGWEYFLIERDAQLEEGLSLALEFTRRNRPAAVEVRLDKSHPTYFSQQALTSLSWRLPPA